MRSCRWWMGIPLLVGVSVGCDLEGLDGEDDIEPVEQALTTVLDVSFESYPLGALGSPWSTVGTQGQASIVSTSDHGKVLRLRGGRQEGIYSSSSLPLSSQATQITTEVDIKPGAGAGFLWTLHGAGTSIGRRRIRLQRAPNQTTLIAQTAPSGSTDCGTLADGVWSHVTLTVRSTFPRSFDVAINGTPTCTDVSSGLAPTFNAVSVMDASNQDWGGDVLFDNILVTTP
jgi:hypothetical protein